MQLFILGHTDDGGITIQVQESLLENTWQIPNNEQ